MPKPYTFPKLYDETFKISLSKLKEWGYLEQGQTKSGRITWSRNGEPTGSISIFSNTISPLPFIELNYKYGDEDRRYKVYLTSIPSNIGKGAIWYFVCPQTKQLCRILYSFEGYFLHREAFNGCMYESQTHSKKYRRYNKVLGAYFRLDDMYGQLYQKHFKKTYAGRYTKKYLRIKRQIKVAESISYQEIETLFLAK